jgi:uncharacterized membrane protein (DUF373 family)
MNDLWPRHGPMQGFNRIILSIVQLLLMGLVLLGLIDLIVLMVRVVAWDLLRIDSVTDLQDAMQEGFSGILLVLVGLELLETVRSYLHHHRVRVEVVLIVAIIALGRHIVELELEGLSGSTLLGIAALMLALTLGYFLTRFHSARRPWASPAPQPAEPVPQADADA